MRVDNTLGDMIPFQPVSGNLRYHIKTPKSSLSVIPETCASPPPSIHSSFLYI